MPTKQKNHKRISAFSTALLEAANFVGMPSLSVLHDSLLFLA